MTVDLKAVEAKLKEMHPEIEKFGLALKVDFDSETNSVLATLSKGGDSLSTHIDPEDAEKCLDNVECVHFGLKVDWFVNNYCKGSDACEA